MPGCMMVPAMRCNLAMALMETAVNVVSAEKTEIAETAETAEGNRAVADKPARRTASAFEPAAEATYGC